MQLFIAFYFNNKYIFFVPFISNLYLRLTFGNTVYCVVYYVNWHKNLTLYVNRRNDINKFIKIKFR